MIRIKFCGMTNIDDALKAVSLGVNAIGFVFAESPRKIDAATAKEIISRLPPFVTTVGVFVNEELDKVTAAVKECGLDYVQLHGNESPEYCKRVPAKVIKTIKHEIAKIPSYKVSGILIDTYDPYVAGGTGKTGNWDIALGAKQYDKPIILAGGLTPENVAEAIRVVVPYAVDVSSGIESSPGKKDFHKMKAFVEAVRICMKL